MDKHTPAKPASSIRNPDFSPGADKALCKTDQGRVELAIPF